MFSKIKETIYKVKDYDRLEYDYCNVLDRVTGSRLSKPNYTLSAVHDAINEHLEEHDGRVIEDYEKKPIISNNALREGITHFGITQYQIDNWLKKYVDVENQQKPADKVEPKFKIGDIIRLKDGDGLEWTVEEVFNNGTCTIVCADRDDFILPDDNWELVEQNPAWSDEDEYCINQLIVFCENCMVPDSGAIKCAHWLKSLKDRYTWKPSDKQMDALRKASKNEYLKSEQYDILVSLYNDLKKL